MIAASFFLTAYINNLINLDPPSLVVQIANSLLGLFFTGLAIGSVSQVARSRGWAPELNLFGPIIEAMQKIAKGDFSVRLDNTFRKNEPASVLVKSINDMALELNQMEQMRQEFISNVSHEIQSPLTSIRGFAQALQNDQLSPDERHHYLSIIESESTRLSRITEDLLKLASLESKQLKYEPKPYRLDKQIRSLILACEPQWTAKGIDMDVALEEAEITADEDLLSQVWINLIHNSIKFTPQCGSVQICMRREDGQIQLRVADTGIGIAEQDRARVFERFYKADSSRTSSNGGSGLGLSIAKKIVEMHGGTIEVESALGAGAAFTVCLPAG
jgi:signal transduction histidine kinase